MVIINSKIMALCEPFFIAKNGVFLYNIIVMNERKLKVYLDGVKSITKKLANKIHSRNKDSDLTKYA